MSAFKNDEAIQCAVLSGSGLVVIYDNNETLNPISLQCRNVAWKTTEANNGL